MNDLDLCLEVVQGHVNHNGVNISKTTWARDFKFGTRGMMSGRTQKNINNNNNKKAVLPQGNRAMPHVFFSVEVCQQHSLQV